MDELVIYKNNQMLQNKNLSKFFNEIFKSFFLILFALSLIAITIRAVSFLDLIVENGYSVSTYFFYSLLNLFGIIPKFIALSFYLISKNIHYKTHKR